MKALLVAALVFFTFQAHSDPAPDTASILRVAGDMSAILSNPDVKRIMTAGQPQSAVDYIMPSTPNTYEIQAQMSCATIQAHENVLANGQPVLGITSHPCEYTMPPSTIDYDAAAHEMLKILADSTLPQRFDYKYFPDRAEYNLLRLTNSLKPIRTFALQSELNHHYAVEGAYSEDGSLAGFNYIVQVNQNGDLTWKVINPHDGGGPGGGASVGN